MLESLEVGALVAAVALLAPGTLLQCPDQNVYTANLNAYFGGHDVAGMFFWADRRVVLSPAICPSLAALASGYSPISHPPPVGVASGDLGEDGFAIFVLAHELSHAAGIVDETEADCNAAKTFFSVGRALNVPQRDLVQVLLMSAYRDGYNPGLTIGCFPSLMPRAT